MAISRRAADESVLRDPAALEAYINDQAKLLLDLSIEMQVISRSVGKRLGNAQGRSVMMSPAEKRKAAAAVTRGLRNTAMLMRAAQGQLAKADGVLQEVFVNTRRKSRSGGRGGGRGGGQQGGGQAA